jgi:DNA-binding transcriptional MerR regulator
MAELIKSTFTENGADNHMTIAQFACRTGLPPATLRFYETKKMLIPAHRAENGYRLYNKEQINKAKLIHSLRQAGVGLKEIVQFLHGDAQQQDEQLRRLRKEAEARLLSVQIARQYLGGVRPGQHYFHLTMWDDIRDMLWYKLKVKITDSIPLNICIGQRIKELHGLGYKMDDSGYIRNIQYNGPHLEAELGFLLAKSDFTRKDTPEGVIKEPVIPTLFATFECASTETFPCLQAVRYLNHFGFEPVGGRWERHMPESLSYEIMIPIMVK